MCRKRDCHNDLCQCPGGKTERFLQPCLLLTLRQQPSYGYDLLEKIMAFGFLDGPADPGTVYRHLRKMEQDGFVSSSWDTSGTGPARRYYRLTKEGENLLGDWIPFMERSLKSLEKFLGVFRRVNPAREKEEKENGLQKPKMRLPSSEKAERKAGKLFSPADPGLPRDIGKASLRSKENFQEIDGSKVRKIQIRRPDDHPGHG